MPLKTYSGPAVGPLLALARAELGPDAVVLKVANRAGTTELYAADPDTAAALSRMGGADEGPAPAGTEPATRAARGATPARTRSPLFIAFVGPTGAGKTTTLAKLAAHPRVFAGRRVGLLNLDTYRLGAIEQVEAYAALEHLPVASAYGSADLAEALKRLEDREVILVDCPGRGPRTRLDLDGIRRLLERLGPEEVHLVLPAGMQPRLIRRAIEQHRSLGVTHLLASKVDEMPDDWCLFDIAAELGLPMRWLADGQRVPQDIRSAAARIEASRASRRGRRARREGAVA